MVAQPKLYLHYIEELLGNGAGCNLLIGCLKSGGRFRLESFCRAQIADMETMRNVKEAIDM
jgi:hypothetical protein